MTSIAKTCRHCGRHFHVSLWWHMHAPIADLCDLCEPDRLWLPMPPLPSPSELSDEPVVNPDVIDSRQRFRMTCRYDGQITTDPHDYDTPPRTVDTRERFRMTDPHTAELTLDDGTTVRHHIP